MFRYEPLLCQLGPGQTYLSSDAGIRYFIVPIRVDAIIAPHSAVIRSIAITNMSRNERGILRRIGLKCRKGCGQSHELNECVEILHVEDVKGKNEKKRRTVTIG